MFPVGTGFRIDPNRRISYRPEAHQEYFSGRYRFKALQRETSQFRTRSYKQNSRIEFDSLTNQISHMTNLASMFGQFQSSVESNSSQEFCYRAVN